MLGYERTASGVKFFGRSYFDDEARQEELFTQNNHTLFDHIPGDELRLYDRTCEPISMADAPEDSLKACLDMFRPCDKFGYDAYRMMITGLEKKEYNFISSIVGSLIDARRAAYIYLQDSASLVTGDQRSRMQKLSSIHKDMFLALNGDGLYDRLQQTCYTPEDMRKGPIAGLQKSVELEREARVIVEDILDSIDIKQTHDAPHKEPGRTAPARMPASRYRHIRPCARRAGKQYHTKRPIKTAEFRAVS